MEKNNEEIKKPELEVISWRNFWRELWRLLRPFRKLFSGITVIIIFSAGLSLLAPYILKLLISFLTINYEISNKWDIGRLMSFLRKENKFKTIKRGFISK